MAEVGASVAGGATNYVLTHGDREASYLIDFASNTKTLKIKAQELAAARVNLQNLIDASLNNNEVIKESVTIWRERVDTVVEDARKLSDEATKINRWYKQWRPRSRFNLRRKAIKKIDEIEVLLTEKSGFGSVGDPKPFQRLDIVSFDDFVVFPSREDTRKKILNALQNNQVSMIGIFGMPGVGKTMLMGAIRKQAKDDKLFDEVVLVTVSQEPDIRWIQEVIAHQLHLDLRDSSMLVAAMKLSERLTQGRKVLIVFDDIWEALDMEKVGIPYQSSQVCKVLFTTRSGGVCDLMGVDKTNKIEVKVLSNTEAWELFKQKAGDVVESSSHQELARDVLNECKGLPLAIVTQGLMLRNKDKAVWLYHRTRPKESINDGMRRIVHIVKLSYDFLHDDRAAQMCFLFCALFPEDFRIKTDVLLSYMLGEDLLKMGDSMEETRKELLTIVDKLSSSGILLRSEEGDIMMHNIIRDAAISISSDPKEGEGFIVRAGLGLKEWPLVDREMETCKRLSLMSNNLRFGLPEPITSSLLLTLSLSRNPNLEKIPSDFFKNLKHLKTLDLSETGIRSLPESFRCLESLRTLLMDFCRNLTDISLVGELGRLEILSICGSKEAVIPVSLQKLINLKMLNTSLVKSRFPPEVISRLEKLYLLIC